MYELCHQPVGFLEPSIVYLLGFDCFSLIEVELGVVDGDLLSFPEFLLIFLFLVLNQLFLFPLHPLHYHNRIGSFEIFALHQWLVLLPTFLSLIENRLKSTALLLAKVAFECLNIEPIIFAVM
jgi:hypothetical protein